MGIDRESMCFYTLHIRDDLVIIANNKEVCRIYGSKFTRGVQKVGDRNEHTREHNTCLLDLICLLWAWMMKYRHVGHSGGTLMLMETRYRDYKRDTLRPGKRLYDSMEFSGVRTLVKSKNIILIRRSHGSLYSMMCSNFSKLRGDMNAVSYTHLLQGQAILWWAPI